VPSGRLFTSTCKCDH